MTQLFTRAALRILVTTGRPADVEFARQFASSDVEDLRVEALRLLERSGTAHDVPVLISLAGRVYDDDLRRWAASTALRLAYKKDKLNS